IDTIIIDYRQVVYRKSMVPDQRGCPSFDLGLPAGACPPWGRERGSWVPHPLALELRRVCFRACPPFAGGVRVFLALVCHPERSSGPFSPVRVRWRTAHCAVEGPWLNLATLNIDERNSDQRAGCRALCGFCKRAWG